MGTENICRGVLTGNLTRDVELREYGEGKHVANMRVAFNKRAKKGDEWVDQPGYIDVSVFGRQAESCKQYLAKGSAVAVDGRLEWREWEGQDNVKRQAISIIADSVQFLTRKDDSSTGGEAPAAATVPAGDGPDEDDDIPF